MADESVTNAQLYTANRGLERRSVYVNEQNNINNSNKSSRKFRWSSCFSFISTKFKKPKSQKIPPTYVDELEHKKHGVSERVSPEIVKEQEVVVVKATGSSWKQQQQHHQHHLTSSLSPPPRQTKNKRDSSLSQLQHTHDNDNKTKDRRPLVDPTLTPRVKPRSIKSKKQPSLLRLSLDAELLQQHSPDGIFHDTDSSTASTCKTGHSSFTFTPTSATQYPPFRSGTLGAVKNGKPRLSTSTNESDIPPLPLPRINITSGFDSNSRPNSQSTTHTNASYVTDSPTSISAVDGMIPNDDDEEKLTLKERRHRRSPLSMPGTDQLTLALKGFMSETELDSQPIEPKREQVQEPHFDISSGDDEQDHMWRQQLLEQTIAFSLQNKSRQDAMLTLEGKKSRSYQPNVAVHQYVDQFTDDDDTKTITTNGDLVKDKAQYDAIVSRTHKRQLTSHEDGNNNNGNNYRTSLRVESSSANEKKDPAPTTMITSNHLDIITENEIANNITTPISANKMLLFPTHGQRCLSVTPETPPPHQQNAPSLISAPSTPNSFDSSVLDHDDYINDRLHHLAAFIHPST